MRMDIFRCGPRRVCSPGSARLCLPIYATPRPGNRTCTRLLTRFRGVWSRRAEKEPWREPLITKGKARNDPRPQMQSIAMVYQNSMGK